MRKSEPNSESGNPSGPSAGGGQNPVSRRAAIAAKARKNPKEQFNNLLHHLTYELIAECLNEIPQSSVAGVDGMSVKQARENLSWLLPPILKQIHEGSYAPPPVRRKSAAACRSPWRAAPACATVLQGCHRSKFLCRKLGHSGDPYVARASELEHPVQAGGGDGDFGGLGLVSSRS